MENKKQERANRWLRKHASKVREAQSELQKSGWGNLDLLREQKKLRDEAIERLQKENPQKEFEFQADESPQLVMF